MKYKGKNYFVLLGWKGFNQQITKKVIEVCYIDKGELKFGFPLLKSGSVYKNRLIYSFNSQASMSMRFENNGKKIILVQNPLMLISPLKPDRMERMIRSI